MANRKKNSFLSIEHCYDGIRVTQILSVFLMGWNKSVNWQIRSCHLSLPSQFASTIGKRNLIFYWHLSDKWPSSSERFHEILIVLCPCINSFYPLQSRKHLINNYTSILMTSIQQNSNNNYAFEWLSLNIPRLHLWTMILYISGFCHLN